MKKQIQINYYYAKTTNTKEKKRLYKNKTVLKVF